MSDLKSIKAVTVELLKDTLDAEHQLIEALPRLVEASSNASLKKAFKNHLTETRNHVIRVERAFKLLGEKAERKRCKGMAGLIKEGDEAGQEHGHPALVDAGIIAAAQKCEHYEIVAYGTLRAYAEMMGNRALGALFQKTLKEESGADKKLTSISEGKLLKELSVGRSKVKTKEVKKTPRKKPAKKPAAKKPVAQKGAAKRSK